MPYTVQFLGLVCFYREHGVRLALLPDGRDPQAGIDPHYASIIVDPVAVEVAHGWPASDDMARGIYQLDQPCSVSFEAASAPGTFDVSAHDGLLPQLRAIDPNFEIDPPRAQTIARVAVRQGKLAVYQVPGGSAVMSQLKVHHDGSIKIAVSPDDGSGARILQLAPGTEILLANMSRHGVYDRDLAEDDDHFRIYEKLSVRPVTLHGPAMLAQNFADAPSNHWFFRDARPINLSLNCSNTGCC